MVCFDLVRLVRWVWSGVDWFAWAGFGVCLFRVIVDFPRLVSLWVMGWFLFGLPCNPKRDGYRQDGCGLGECPWHLYTMHNTGVCGVRGTNSCVASPGLSPDHTKLN